MFECMSDCIHLKACRRVQAIGRKHRLLVPRYCTEDCTAYRSKDEIIEVATLEDVRDAVEWAVNEIKDGMDWVEARSIKGHSIAEILGDE